MLTREEALAIYHAGPETVVRVLLEMDARIHDALRAIDGLEQQVRDLTLRLDASEQRVKHLEDQLAKNSRNSSKPPSTDGFQKPAPRSLREKSARPSGGQPGHTGKTLTMVEKPDRTERHRIEHCECCGRSLAACPPDGIEKRQVHDLPPLRLIVTEHQVEMKRCPCGHLNKATFPEGVNAPVQYGCGVKAAAVYLKNYQFLPYERTCELLDDLFNCGIGEGTLANLIGECHERLEAPVRQIKSQIAQAPVAQFDESGSRVEKKLWWLHAASTATATDYDIHPKRGAEALDAIGILPDFPGRAIHDFWKPYFGYECDHGLCNAHHLRERIFVYEQHRQAWADAMIDCLLDIKAAVAQARPTTDHLTEDQLRDFEDRYQRILDDGLAVNPLSASPAPARKKRGRRKKTKPRNLLERLDEHRQEVLAFMYDFNVPFDNNRAERDIRMMKVQQKISGMFRSEAGAHAFCRIRSYISTARKNALGAMDAIARVFAGNPFVPSLNTS
ncbi:IS66 family transposase [bacterium]|nr:IS66 family transposase [bacterium]